MKEYKIAYIQRYLGIWYLGIKNNEESVTKWIPFNTKKEAIARFKTMYAPIGTKKVVKVKSTGIYEKYEAI